MQQNVEVKILRKHQQSTVQENNKEFVTLVFHAAAIKFCFPGYEAILSGTLLLRFRRILVPPS
jgi:hypothetical protein